MMVVLRLLLFNRSRELALCTADRSSTPILSRLVFDLVVLGISVRMPISAGSMLGPPACRFAFFIFCR